VEQLAMPRTAAINAEPRDRHRLPVPFEMRERQPFLVDVMRMEIIAPWPRRRPAPGDEWRMWQTIQSIDVDALPALLCWCWPDRDPEPVSGVGPGWLMAYARDHSVYRLPRR
jgi:hypothetical protein